LLAAKRYESAVQDFAAVQEMIPAAVQAALLEANAWYELGRKEAAEAIFKDAHARAAQKDRWRWPSRASTELLETTTTRWPGSIAGYSGRAPVRATLDRCALRAEDMRRLRLEEILKEARRIR
jgi:tetratricopeptide (TPR) repeat protein